MFGLKKRSSAAGQDNNAPYQEMAERAPDADDTANHNVGDRSPYVVDASDEQRALEDQQQPASKCRRYCSWRCWCLSTLGATLLTTLIVVLVLFTSVAPKFAQQTLDQSSMDVLGGTISDPTGSSIALQTQIVISNAGFLNGTLSESVATVYNEGIKMGVMRMPQMNTVANENTLIEMTSTLNVTNKTQFQISCKKLLQKTDQVWQIRATGVSLTVEAMGSHSYSVDIVKDLVLKGANMYNFRSTGLDVVSATNSTIHSTSNLSFISDSLFTFALPPCIMSVYFEGVYIGYSPLAGLAMTPGFNELPMQSLVIESFPDEHGERANREVLNKFFSEYNMGHDQLLVMKGPHAGVKNGRTYTSSVLDFVIEQEVVAVGYRGPDLAFGGLVTSATLQGWKVTTATGTTQVQGSYANFFNPLSVPVRITSVSAIVAPLHKVSYHVKLISYLQEFDCETSVFAHLTIGPGIDKHDPNITWVDVGPRAKATYFVSARPPPGTMPQSCLTFDVSCCFATFMTAYSCSLNPDIQKNPTSGELTINHMPLTMDVNMTALIDGQFEINQYYYTPYMPLYFGWQVYGGYLSDLNLNCKSFKFY